MERELTIIDHNINFLLEQRQEVVDAMDIRKAQAYSYKESDNHDKMMQFIHKDTMKNKPIASQDKTNEGENWEEQPKIEEIYGPFF